MTKALLVHHSRTGNTKAMAQDVAEGVKEIAGDCRKKAVLTIICSSINAGFS